MLITTALMYESNKRAFNLIFGKNSEKELAFNIDTFRKIKSDTESAVTELNELKGNVLTSIDELRSGWKTPAGEYFFEHVDTDWTAQLDKYVKTLQVFEDVMDSLIEIFTDVGAEVGKLQL